MHTCVFPSHVCSGFTAAQHCGITARGFLIWSFSEEVACSPCVSACSGFQVNSSVSAQAELSHTKPETTETICVKRSHSVCPSLISSQDNKTTAIIIYWGSVFKLNSSQSVHTTQCHPSAPRTEDECRESWIYVRTMTPTLTLTIKLKGFFIVSILMSATIHMMQTSSNSPKHRDS